MGTLTDRDKEAKKELEKRTANVLKKVKYVAFEKDGKKLEKDLIPKMKELYRTGKIYYINNIGSFPGSTIHHLCHVDNATIAVGYDDVYILARQSEMEKTKKSLEEKLRIKLKIA